MVSTTGCCEGPLAKPGIHEVENGMRRRYHELVDGECLFRAAVDWGVGGGFYLMCDNGKNDNDLDYKDE